MSPTDPRSRTRAVTTAVGVYVLVLLTLQIFLLTLGLDALIGNDPDLAWVAAACSVVLGGSTLLFYRYLR